MARVSNSFRLIATLTLALTVAAGDAVAQAETAALSSSAEQLYGAARPKLLQIRTLLVATGRQSSIGSGFLAGEDALAITNYHVVSQAALEPDTYRLEYVGADGHKGELKLLAIDLPNDLALVRLDQSGAGFFELGDTAGEPPKGERLYSMGDPLDLGFTIVEGTYSGLVERSYNERIHFTGALNPGMSGGPAVTGDGRVAGVNVAKQQGGELVSFLVPVRFAAALLARARGAEPLEPAAFHAEIGRQLAAWQARLYASFAERGFRAAGFGPYQAAESTAPWFTCWSQTNAGQVPKPRASVDVTNCNSDTQLFIAGDLTTGLIHIGHSFVRALDLNAFQFAAFLTQQAQTPWLGGFGRKWLTQRRCHEDFVTATPEGEHPALRAVWCARAYREFAGLYDVSVTAVTEDRGSEALVSRLTLQAIDYDDALKITRLFLEDMQWTR
ncbi:MAG TPA: serine protease [Stellaceae bacterium]|nr:serine protease [Stellaceae bacterium]